MNGSHPPLRLTFMGTPDFALPCLQALIEAGHDVVCVYTQPPRPAGRGKKPRLSPVHEFANKQNIPVRTPARLKDPEIQQDFAALGLDAAVVVAYGLILPQAVLDAPKFGCLNLHGSLLPRWRGAAPIQRAVMAGDTEGGISIMQMDAGLDTGPVLLMEEIPIPPDMTAGDLHDSLAELGAEAMVRALDGLASGALTAQPQPSQSRLAEDERYAAKIEPQDAVIDWSRPAADINNQIRGLSPAPGAWFEFNNIRIKVFAAEIVALEDGAVAGAVLDDRLTIACGHGALRLLELQRQGKGRMPATALLNGLDIPVGTILG